MDEFVEFLQSVVVVCIVVILLIGAFVLGVKSNEFELVRKSETVVVEDSDIPSGMSIEIY